MCATIINISFFQFDIYEQVCEIYKQNNYSLDAILTASLYFFGVCIGSIACGFNTHTWSTRWTNVKKIVNSLHSGCMPNIAFFTVYNCIRVGDIERIAILAKHSVIMYRSTSGWNFVWFLIHCDDVANR